MRRRPVAEVLADLEANRREIETISEGLPASMTEEEEMAARGHLYARESEIARELPEEEHARLWPGDYEDGVRGIRGLARWFGVTPRTIRRWMGEEGFPSQRPDGLWDAQRIQVWIDEERVPVPDYRWRGDRLRY